MLPNHCHVLLIFILSVTSWCSLWVAGQTPPAPGPAPEPSSESKVYPVDEKKFNTFKDNLCEHVPNFGGSEEPSKWSDTLTDDEIYELAFLNMGYGLTADAIAHLPIDLGWRKILLDQMAYIARTTCNTPAISAMFLTGVKNLFLYYMMKYEKTLMNGTDTAKQAAWKAEKHQEKWREILNALSKCAAELEPIAFQDDCGILDSFTDSKGMTQPTKIVEEQYDDEFDTVGSTTGVDIVVDSVWWMFTATYARCYAHFYPNEDIILLFLQRFREDIIKFFADRWRGAGELVEQFEVIFGPITALIEHENLRKCATSAFDYEGLVGRHLVRPVTVVTANGPSRNFKLESEVKED